MKRSNYDGTVPMSEHEVLESLKSINQRRAGHLAEQEGRKADLDKVKQEVQLCERQIHDILRALNEGRQVYRLRSGEVTLEAPDSQMDIVDVVESPEFQEELRKSSPGVEVKATRKRK